MQRKALFHMQCRSNDAEYSRSSVINVTQTAAAIRPMSTYRLIYLPAVISS